MADKQKLEAARDAVLERIAAIVGASEGTLAEEEAMSIHMLTQLADRYQMLLDQKEAK